MAAASSSSSSQSFGGQRSQVYLSRWSGDVSHTFIGLLLHSWDPDLIPISVGGLLTKVDIEAVGIVIVIFSRGYFDCSLLRNELVMIMEQKKSGRLIVKPVFYDINLEEVKKQTGGFSEECLEVDSENLKRWREALSEVGNLTGCCFVNSRDETEHVGSNVTNHEAMLVKCIIEDVKAMLADAPSEVVESRENVHSPSSSVASSSQSQGRGCTQVYLSFSKCNVSKKFLYCLDRKLNCIEGGWEYNYWNIEAVENSRIALIVFSEGYIHSARCRKELARIMESENQGKLIVRLISCDEDPSKSTWRLPYWLPEFAEIDSETMKKWKGVLEEKESWHLNDGRDDDGNVTRIVTDVKAMLNNTTPCDDWERPRSNTEVPSLNSNYNRWIYDVFLSFRGPDTRYNIISHLYKALWQNSVCTFKDSPELEPGQKRADLFVAITKSRIAIVMFSRNYACSKWCLDELKLIMKRKQSGELSVVPIFYKVSPEEVRLKRKNESEKGCYETAMEEMKTKYDKDDPQLVESWKQTLWKTGDLIGVSLEEGNDESNKIDEVVDKVIKSLHRVPPEVAKYPIGISARLKEVKPLLKIGTHLPDVHMLGIYGPRGAGKTTLCKAICNDICGEFDSWCLLSEVRHTPLIELQKRLLWKLLSKRDLEVDSVDEGKEIIPTRLGRKRVLVILDDVDKPGQLDALAGGIDWFGEGSRIIITTTDCEVLIKSGVRCRHEIKLLDEAEAGELFRYHASAGKPKDLCMNTPLINKFLVKANGNPKELVEIGRCFFSVSECRQESLVEKLEQCSPQDILSVLKAQL